MDHDAFLEHVGSPAWAEETMELFRDILKRTDCPFPEYLAEKIRDALLDWSTREWMVAQLLRLCEVHPRDAHSQIRMVDGALLYSNRVTYVVHGVDLYLRETGWDIVDDRPLVLVGGKPCWVELNRQTREECVVWAGTRGKAYRMNAVSGLTDADGKPCYLVNDDANGDGENVGFVVIGETEGKHFRRVRDLMVAHGKPAYVGNVAYANDEFVWGDGVVCEGASVGRLVVVGGVPAVSVRPSHESRTRQLWVGRERTETADEIEGPSIVNGELAYAMFHRPINLTTVVIGGEIRSYPGQPRNWWTHRRTGNAFVVFSVQHEGVAVTYVNHAKLCDGSPQPNAIWLGDDGTTLRIRLEGEGDRAPRTFNLKELGIL